MPLLLLSVMSWPLKQAQFLSSSSLPSSSSSSLSCTPYFSSLYVQNSLYSYSVLLFPSLSIRFKALALRHSLNLSLSSSLFCLSFSWPLSSHISISLTHNLSIWLSLSLFPPSLCFHSTLHNQPTICLCRCWKAPIYDNDYVIPPLVVAIAILIN